MQDQELFEENYRKAYFMALVGDLNVVEAILATLEEGSDLHKAFVKAKNDYIKDKKEMDKAVGMASKKEEEYIYHFNEGYILQKRGLSSVVDSLVENSDAKSIENQGWSDGQKEFIKEKELKQKKEREEKLQRQAKELRNAMDRENPFGDLER